MEPEHDRENAPEGTEAEGGKARPSPKYGVIGQVTKLLGKAVGLAQVTTVKAAGGIASAGRRTGCALRAPSKKIRGMVSGGKRKEGEGEEDFDAYYEGERLKGRIEGLYVRIGERICHTPLIDRSVLAADPQLVALVSSARELEVDAMDVEMKHGRPPEKPQAREPGSSTLPPFLPGSPATPETTGTD